jgi:Homeodomain
MLDAVAAAVHQVPVLRVSHPVASCSSESSEAASNTPKPKPQSIIVPTSAAADAKVVDPGTSPGSDPALPANANAPVVGVGYFPVLPPATFVYENQNESQSQSASESLSLVSPSLSVTGSIILGGKPSRPRHRMSTDKLETLEAFFRRNTHPSRKEKEAICKDLGL